MEVNERWISELQELQKNYPYSIEYPLDNVYGIALYSKFKFKEQEIKFFNGDEVPSIHTKLVMPSGKEIQFHGMHPVPPVPSSKYPDNVGKKEVALIKAGKMVAKDSLSSIVAGDFNDVSWSQTTRKKKEKSKTSTFIFLGSPLFLDSAKSKPKFLSGPVTNDFTVLLGNRLLKHQVVSEYYNRSSMLGFVLLLDLSPQKYIYLVLLLTYIEALNKGTNGF